MIFTVLHAGGKFEQATTRRPAACTASARASSTRCRPSCVATVKRDGAQWEMAFKRGKPTGPLKKVGAARGSGTTVYFHPDSTIFPKVEFDAGD